MPLPLSSLGPAAAGLPLDQDSGAITNATAAEQANQPVTAAALARLGRTGGYMLDYNDLAARALAKGHGLLGVTTEVDAYRNQASAGAGLEFVRKDFSRVTVARSPLLRVTMTRFSPARAGDSGYGLLGELTPENAPTVYAANVAFRHGSLVGSVTVTAADPDGLVAFARSLARRLDLRVTAVLRGSLQQRPVALPAKPKAGPPPRGPDLSKLALGAADFPSSKIVHQGYQVDTDLEPISEYDRQMAPAGTFADLDSQVALFRSPVDARYSSALVMAGIAAPSELKQQFGGTFGGVAVKAVSARPVAVKAGDGAQAVVVTIELANGVALEGVFVSVRVGSTVGLTTAFAPLGQKVGPRAVANVVTTVANRLERRSAAPVA